MEYIEFIILPPGTSVTDNKMITLSWDSTSFKQLMATSIAKAKKLQLKPFMKNIKVYTKDNLIMESEPDCETRVFSKDPIDYKIIVNNIIQLTYKKSKVPVHTFPCTVNLHNISQVQTLTIRMHNRVFLNFEIADNKHRRIYINYNHEDGVNQPYVFDKIAQAFKLLDVVAPTFEIFREICKTS
jgi:hypothetical protein